MKKIIGENMAHETNSTTLSGVRQRSHDGVDKIMDRAESIRDSSMEALDRLNEKASMMKNNVDGYIKRNPEKSVLIAAGVGAIIGGIFAAAMMRKRN